MSYLTQKTINNEVSFGGIALHSGLNVNIWIKPAVPNFGIVFKRVDLKNGKVEKKITATVFDVVSKRKISTQVPHTEIVRW